MAIKLTTTDDVLGNKRGVEVVPTVEDVFGILQKGFKNLINAYYASYYFGLTKEATLGLLGVANGPYSPKTLAEQAGLDTSDPNKQITIFDFASGKLAENPRYGYFTAKVSDTAWDTSSPNFTSILEPGTTEPKNGCEIGITCFFVDIAQNNGSNKLGGSANWSQGTKRWDIYPDNEVVIDNDTIIDVDGKIAVALSLHNAEGQDSIIQKYTGHVDVLHFENTSTGESAAVLGESNSNAGNRNLVDGKLNVITVDTANSIIAGLGNGRGTNNNPSLSPIAGNNILLVGLNNQSKKSSSGVTPDNNIIGGESNVVTGIKNSLVVGFDNHPSTAADNSITAGSHNYNLAQSALVIGDNLYSRAPYSLTIGTWNSPNENYRLTIGNGTDDSHRSNAFVVTNTGIARAYGAPVGNNDVVRKLELDTAFANLNIENGTGDYSLVQKEGDISTGESDDRKNYAYGRSNVVFGHKNKTYQRDSFAFGGGNKVGLTESEFLVLYPSGVDGVGKGYSESYSFGIAIGENNEVTSRSGSALGVRNEVSGQGSVALGGENNVTGSYSLAAGSRSSATGIYSVAVGQAATASNQASFAAGYSTLSSGVASVAEGDRTVASGKGAHAEGTRNTASGEGAHAEGYMSDPAIGSYGLASGVGSHAENVNNIASGIGSHAGGVYSRARGPYHFVHGDHLISSDNGATQGVFGKYNADNTRAAFIVGNGTDVNTRSNAFEVTYEGVARAYGTPSGNNDLVTKGFSDTYYAANVWATDADMDALFGISAASAVSPIQNGGNFDANDFGSSGWL